MWPQSTVDSAVQYRNANKDKFDAIGLTEEIVARVARYFYSLWSMDMFHLFREVSKTPVGGTYLEIGSAFGGSFLCAREASNAFDKKLNIKAISVFGDKKQENSCAETARSIGVQLLIRRSSEAHNTIKESSVDVLYVDGSHTFEDVKSDLENYRSKVKPGGVILCHDFDFIRHSPVVAAVLSVFTKEKIIKFENSCVCKIPKK